MTASAKYCLFRHMLKVHTTYDFCGRFFVPLSLTILIFSSHALGAQQDSIQTTAQTVHGTRAAADSHPQMHDSMPMGEKIGTQSDPLVVTIHPEPKSKDELIKDAQKEAEKAASDRETITINHRLLIVGILQLVVFLAQLLVFGYQALKLRETVDASAAQSRDMKESIAASIRAAVAMEKVAISSARGSQAASESVAALRERTAQQMRAYLSVVTGGATYQESQKGLRFEANPVILNTGHTPAHRVNAVIRADILPLPLPDDFSFELPADSEAGQAVLGPNQNRILSAVVQRNIPDEDVQKTKAGTGQALYVWGRVSYDDVFGEHRLTRFCQIMVWLPNGNVFGYFTPQHNDAT
ncbi:hypothetical protein [Paraburkholderia kururiensis]|uniref:hypothetical protein n=1 Tax=Paraburkholderia kururiensis TaxID=984307 RepID=UPI0018F74F6C|nr:hypothetical protein [Paraburkholderia kururiensis]